MPIHEKIQAFFDGMGEDDRLRSWDHCYEYFHRYHLNPTGLLHDRDNAALQLAFYLASWGMYRGSSFLLKYDYTVHRTVIDQLVAPQFESLWRQEFGAGEDDINLCQTIIDAAEAIRRAYNPFADRVEASGVTDTLVTKVLLGTFGCLPACDQYFVAGWRIEGLPFSYLTRLFVDRVLEFCRAHLAEFQQEQAQIEREETTAHYPLMKLMDMYFWQTGYEAT